MKAAKRIEVYDTTLRDGAMGMGVSFSTAGKVRLVERLDRIGFQFVEGGFPGSGPKDMDFIDAVRRLRLSTVTVAAFGSTRLAHAKAATDNNLLRLLRAGTPVVTVFGKAWRLHVTDVLRTTRDENLAMIADTVRFLKRKGRKVIFDAEHFYDGYKDDPSFAMDAAAAAVDAGCAAVVLCDTNGGCLPHEVFEITRKVVESAAVPVGIHAHNDAGMAAANSIEAVRAGAVHVQGTVNGYGERAGNANLCTVIPTLELKLGRRCIGRESLRQLRGVSLFVDDLANLRPDERQPYVGAGAFAHKAGMHVDAVQKNPRTFEHVPPDAVGNERSVLLSEGSGRSSVLLKAIEMGMDGLEKDSDELRAVVAELKHMESRGYAFEAANASFQILVQKILKKHRPFFGLEGFRVIVEKRSRAEPCISEATIKVRVNDRIAHTVGEGDGPVEALDRALRNALTRFYPQIATVLLTDFRVRILDPKEATRATTRVLIESSDGKRNWGTVGVSPNIIEASWEALVDSIEYKLFEDEKLARRPEGRSARRQASRRS